jgi:dethiobiotin synthetase
VPEIVVVSGTGTEVGKTWVAAHLLAGLRARGVHVVARKPVQSFDSGRDTDAMVLARASNASPDDVCPPHRSYPLALAPPLAADALGRGRIALADLVAETRVPIDGLLLVEGVGGARSPLAHDGDTVALADALGADHVVVVAGAELGTINAVRMTAAVFAPRSVTIFLNRFDPDVQLHKSNRDWLVDVDGYDVVTTIDGLVDRVQKNVSLEVS